MRKEKLSLGEKQLTGKKTKYLYYEICLFYSNTCYLVIHNMKYCYGPRVWRNARFFCWTSLKTLTGPGNNFVPHVQVENKKKNRYPDKLPYDHNRVLLNALINGSNSDYINASTVVRLLWAFAPFCLLKSLYSANERSRKRKLHRSFFISF